MKTRKKILAFVNKIIKEEHGQELKENNLLTDCGIDSFAYAILFMELENKYGCFDKDFIESNIDYKAFKIKNLINRIEQFKKSKNKIRKIRKFKR